MKKFINYKYSVRLSIHRWALILWYLTWQICMLTTVGPMSTKCQLCNLDVSFSIDNQIYSRSVYHYQEPNSEWKNVFLPNELALTIFINQSQFSLFTDFRIPLTFWYSHFEAKNHQIDNSRHFPIIFESVSEFLSFSINSFKWVFFSKSKIGLHLNIL